MRLLDTPLPVAQTAGANWVDCVRVLQVRNLRGYRVANALRFGQSSAGLRTTARLADLAPADLEAFCDWESCMRTDGYGHVCGPNDAGWERCRVCDGGTDCEGLPLSQGDCVVQATSPGRASCHVGLLQECLLQRAIRGPADPRVTQSCALSAQACAGQLPGDVSAQAIAAQRETDQVTVEECDREVARAAVLAPGTASVSYWQTHPSSWDGGLPPDDAGALPDDAFRTTPSGRRGLGVARSAPAGRCIRCELLGGSPLASPRRRASTRRTDAMQHHGDSEEPDPTPVS